MSWFFQSKIAKSHFYVWYLGSKEADGVRGSAVVLPVMRQLLKESFKKTPSKATVQISSKGLKLIQSVPAMSRNGKVKMQLVKFQIAANCLTYSITGRAPFDDVVGVVMLVLNPEMHSPMHVHCYRCDSAETAQIMHANLQLLLSRPDVQRSVLELEQRLFLSGLLVPRTSDSRRSRNTPERGSPMEQRERRRMTEIEDKDTTLDSRKPPSRRVVNELKSKLTRKDSHGKYDDEFRSSMSELPFDNMGRFRMFGDTVSREPKSKSRSLDNLAEPIVSTDLLGRGRFPVSGGVTDPFGQSYERLNTLEGFWKHKVRRTSSIRLDF